ncbi:MAG TPA: aminoacetone oxidase family FAD-binding enzyme, partial [Hyphomonas atlantica]|nr:aminoacetone oxidase family FAD-binding enzyme [Hyphomonas atlantica]
MLLDECEKGSAEIRLSTEISGVTHQDGRFLVETRSGAVSGQRLVVATGGLSIPKMGATALAYDIARQFGHDIVETRPGLVPFTFSGELGEKFAAISGVAAPVIASVPGARFEEDLLFTHRGLSGPAALQTSSYWTSGEPLSLCLQTSEDMNAALRAAKQDSPKQTFVKALEAHVPARLAALLAEVGPIAQDARLADLSHAAIDEFAAFLKDWRVTPMGTEGYRTAEVTVGGISTDGLDQKTMESRHVPGLYFIGECVDVTGWLGG